MCEGDKAGSQQWSCPMVQFSIGVYHSSLPRIQKSRLSQIRRRLNQKGRVKKLSTPFLNTMQFCDHQQDAHLQKFLIFFTQQNCMQCSITIATYVHIYETFFVGDRVFSFFSAVGLLIWIMPLLSTKKFIVFDVWTRLLIGLCCRRLAVRMQGPPQCLLY